MLVKLLPESLVPQRERAFRKEMRQAIAAMLRPAIVFDLPQNIVLDGPSIDFLIRCARDAAEHDAQVILVATNPEHQVLLEMTRLTRVLSVFHSIDEAVAYLKKCSGASSENISQIPGDGSAAAPRPSAGKSASGSRLSARPSSLQHSP